MKPVPYLPEHYFIVQKWWERHDYTPVDYRLLSKYGLIVPKVCAAWLYSTDSLISMINWPVANPDAKARDISEGFDDIMGAFKLRASAIGCPMLMAYTDVPSLSKILIKHKFIMADKTLDSFMFYAR